MTEINSREIGMV